MLPSLTHKQKHAMKWFTPQYQGN